MSYKFVTLLCALILFSGCATTQAPSFDHAAIEEEKNIQHQLELVNTMKYQDRLDRIAYPILKGGHPYCGNRSTLGIGIRAANRDSFPNELREAAVTEFGISDRLQVMSVLKESPAALAGIQVGDFLLNINGTPIPAGKKANRHYEKLLHENYEANENIRVLVERAGDTQEIAVVADRICDYPALIVLDALPQAFADGSIIGVTSGLLRLLDEDRDVAVVVGHELAHNNLNHAGKGMVPEILGFALDWVIGFDMGSLLTAQFSPALEAEADYVGLYMVANSGYTIEGAENVWRTFAAEFGGGKDSTLIDTHPSTPKRYLAIRETVKEINEKKANGLPLTPN